MLWEEAGYLCVDLSRLMRMPHQWMVWDWQHGMGWHIYVDGDLEVSAWYEVPHIPLTALSMQQTRWFQSIPSALQAKVLVLNEHNPELVFPLLRLIARYRHVQELFEDAPLLSLLVMVHAMRHQWSEEEVSKLFTRKRTALLAEIQLPACQSAWKLLGKLHYDVLNRQTWKDIQQMFAGEYWSRLSHERTLDIRAIRCLNGAPDLLDDALFRYCVYQGAVRFLSSQRDCAVIRSRLFRMYFERQASYIELKELYGLMEDTLTMLWNQPRRRRAVLRMSNEAELLRLHDHLAGDHPRQVPDVDFPAPPIPDTKDIQAISHSSELIEEGKAQQHCVACYWKRIAQGQYYVYRMSAPERATIGLIRQHDGTWHVDQLRLRANGTPTQVTKDVVEKWLLDSLKKRGSIR